MYYKIAEHRIVGYRKSHTKTKKYDSIIQNKKTGKIYVIPFGAVGYEHYQDKTGLNLYKSHGDKKRRKLYRARHRKDIKPGYYSPGWMSMNILW